MAFDFTSYANKKKSRKMAICDENNKAFKDPLHVPVGPITKARSKKIKEALNGLIQEIWADFNAGQIGRAHV